MKGDQGGLVQQKPAPDVDGDTPHFPNLLSLFFRGSHNQGKTDVTHDQLDLVVMALQEELVDDHDGRPVVNPTDWDLEFG